jgi:hypothetical protein
MANTDTVFALPEFGIAGLSIVSSATAWAFGPWYVLAERLSAPIAVVGLQFQVTYVLASDDTTYELLFEISRGNPGNEVTKLQFPYSVRRDSNVGYYMTRSITLPEIYSIPAGECMSIRAANSVATALTTEAVRLIYQGTVRVGARSPMPENYKFVTTTMSTGERIR